MLNRPSVVGNEYVVVLMISNVNGRLEAEERISIQCQLRLRDEGDYMYVRIEE
jgi:hypothetical protein